MASGLSLPPPTRDIHRGDYFREIAGGTGVCTLIAFLAPEMGGWAYLSWLAEVVLVPLTLARAWQRMKWVSVKLPLGGYSSFAKGRYLSGHIELIHSEDAILGLTPQALHLSTVSGELTGIDLLHIKIDSIATSTTEAISWFKTVISWLLLMWRPALGLMRWVFSGGSTDNLLVVKTKVPVLDIPYHLPRTGISATLQFAVGNEKAEKEMRTQIVRAVHYRRYMVGVAHGPVPRP